MANILKVIKLNAKEYIVFIIALFMQSYFGYEIVKMTQEVSRYSSYISDNMLKIILMFILFITSSAIILFVAYIYLKKRISRPIKTILKYLFIYVMLEIIIALLMGTLTFAISIEVVSKISTLLQYLFRYIFIFYIFIKVEEFKFTSVKKELFIGVLITIFILILKVFVQSYMIKIIIDVVYYTFIIIRLNVVSESKRGIYE